MNRELAIECIKTQRQFVDNETREAFDWAIYLLEKQSALDEWCTDCKEYDQENHCCPRWNRVIREALKDAQPEERTNERTETHACDSISRQAAMIVIENSGLDDDNKDTVVRVLEQLPSVQPEQRWIPISERLPEYGEDVLCYHEDDDYSVNHIIDDEDGEWFYDGVVAWMPLPEPYEERREK